MPAGEALVKMLRQFGLRPKVREGKIVVVRD